MGVEGDAYTWTTFGISEIINTYIIYNFRYIFSTQQWSHGVEGDAYTWTTFGISEPITCL
jgi:hypothetical protein